MIIVTRHQAFVNYLHEIGLVQEDARVLEHAGIEDVHGQHVIGVLPLHLAVHAASVTIVPLDVPAELRGQELTLEQVRQFAGPPQRFAISLLEQPMKYYLVSEWERPTQRYRANDPRHAAEIHARRRHGDNARVERRRDGLRKAPGCGWHAYVPAADGGHSWRGDMFRVNVDPVQLAQRPSEGRTK